MIPDRFWLADVQFAKIAPLLPSDTRGKARVDDRRVISGIVHELKSGGRWIDAPPEYGPRTTLYNRYVRRAAAKGVSVNLFQALAQAGGPLAQLLIDSSAVKAHRSASGGKGGSAPRRSVSRGDRTTKIHALTVAQCGPVAFICSRAAMSRIAVPGATLSVEDARLRHPAWRRGLRQRRDPPAGRARRGSAEHPAKGQSKVQEPLLALPLSKAQRHRAHVL